MNTLDQFVIRGTFAGTMNVLYYGFALNSEFWAADTEASLFDDLTMANTKMDAIANGETEGVDTMALRDQAGLTGVYVVRTRDMAIMNARVLWEPTPEDKADTGERFILRVDREDTDPLYINVDEDVNLDVTTNLEEAIQYNDINIVRLVIQQLEEASVGQFGNPGEQEQTDGQNAWAELKLFLCRKFANVATGVPFADTGAPITSLGMYERVILTVLDAKTQNVMESHDLRTVIKIEEAKQYAIRIARGESFPILWLSVNNNGEEFFDPNTTRIGPLESVQDYFAYLQSSDIFIDCPHVGLNDFKELILQADESSVEIVDLDRQIPIHSAWIKQPFYTQSVVL